MAGLDTKNSMALDTEIKPIRSIRFYRIHTNVRRTTRQTKRKQLNSSRSAVQNRRRNRLPEKETPVFNIALTLGICAALTYILDPDVVRQIQDFLLSIINGM